MQFCALDDAQAFLIEAKGLPAIPSASERLRLCLRACILLSWVGLEDGLDCAIENWGNRGRTLKGLPTKLKVRMLAFLLPLAEPPLVDAEFDRLRRMRNQLAHPRVRESGPHLTLKDADQTFQFCLGILRAIKTYKMAGPSRDANSRPATALPGAREIQKIMPAKERKVGAVAGATRKSAAL